MIPPHPCPDCGTTIIGRAVRCPACIEKRKREVLRQREYARRPHRANFDAVPGERQWVIVDAADRELWGDRPTFVEGEIVVGAKFGAFEQGTVFANVAQPEVRAVVHGIKLEVMR
jgi:hypothetical protein